MENVAIKGRGGNDVQHKNWKGKILRIWITIIRHVRPWGSRVMALSIKCDSLALRTESREEWIFSSGINCMSVVRVREKVFRNSSDEKGNQGVGDFRFINILQFFSIYYYYFIIFSILFFTHDIYPYLAHTHTRDPLSRPTTSPHYPRTTTFSNTQLGCV